MNNKNYKVMIVDDSQYDREMLFAIIESDPKLKVIAQAENGEEALAMLEHLLPDVITMDVRLPGLDGFEITRIIMEKKPIPVIIVSGGCSPENVEDCFKSMNAGAVDILVKPSRRDEPYFQKKAQDIINAIKAAAEVKLITRKHHLAGNAIKAPSLQLSPIAIKAIAIGASLGGPVALSTILSSLPKNFPLPIFIVQHIVAGFTQGLVDWLNRSSNVTVKLGEDKEKAKAGYAYVAPDGCHMEIKPGDIISLVSESTTGLQPSVARLFNSMAQTYGPHAVAVLLTGMGKDGGREMLKMYQAGAITIAQNEATCMVFGMPKEAIELGGVSQILPIQAIAPVLMELVQEKQ